MIAIERKKLEQVLEALESLDGVGSVIKWKGQWERCFSAITAIKEALAQPAQGPVARIAILEAALNEIAYAGMSASSEMSDNGKKAWHASQAWKFISIAAQAIDKESTPAWERCCYHDSDCAVHNMPAYPAGPCDCGLASLAQPAQEPGAIALNTGTKQGVKWLKNVEHGLSLYTTPQQREPLTRKEIDDGLERAIALADQFETAAFQKGVKYAEAAHNIGETL